MTSSAQKRSCTAGPLRDAPARNSFSSLVKSAPSGALAFCAKVKARGRSPDAIRPNRHFVFISASSSTADYEYNANGATSIRAWTALKAGKVELARLELEPHL